MTDPVVDYTGNLFSFLGNDPSTGGGTNYAALENRRKIALQILAQGSKKGYPKNIGEGLASLGDSLGEIGAMRALQQQEGAYQKQLTALAPSMVPDEARPAPAAPPAAPPAATPGPQASLTPPAATEPDQPAPTADLMPVVDPTEVNAVDQDGTPAPPNVAQQAASTATRSAENLVRPSPYEQRPGVAYSMGSPTSKPPSWLGEQADVNSAMTSTDPGMRIAGAPSPNQVPIAQGGVGAAQPMMATDFKAPSYMKDVIARMEPDPAMRQYYGTMALKEAASPGEVSSTGAKGPFQFLSSTGRQYGLNGQGFDNRADPESSMKAMQAFTKDNMASLTNSLGRPPTLAELALAHQQGAGTAAKMLSGTGNASGGNLAVNNVAPGASPQAAANKIMGYYGLPNTPAPGGRDAVASALAAQPQQQQLAAKNPNDFGPGDAADEARLADVVGMSKGDTGAYAYPSTAMARGGDIMSDAPPVGVTGVSNQTGQAVGDTVQQRDAIIKGLMNQNQTAPAVPQGNPTPAASAFPASTETRLPSTLTATTAGSPPEAAGNRPIVMPDVQPMPAAPPPTPGAQMAQAAPAPQGVPPAVPNAPYAGLPQRPTPAPITAQAPPTPPQPEDVPMTQDEIRGWRLKSNPATMGDPTIGAQADALIKQGQAQRQQEFGVRLKNYESDLALRNQQTLATEEFNRGSPERELNRKAKEAEIAQKMAFGGLDQGELFKEVAKSADSVKSIPAAQIAIQNALRVAPNVFTGATADVNLSLHKLMASAGFPDDPRIAASEQFKAMISPVLASARQALVGGANISDSDMKIARDAVAGNLTLDKDTIPKVLGALDRMNVAAASEHQRKLETIAGGDPQRQATLFGMYGLPMEQVVPRGAIEVLKNSPTPEVMQQFNSKYHTPGLAQKILGGG